MNLYVEITNLCNANCPHCPVPKDKKHSMSVDEFYNVVSKFKEFFDDVGVVISGGEPSLLRNLKDYVQAAKKLDCRVTIATNGTRMQNVLEAEPDAIEISFNSFNREDEDAIMRAPLFLRKLQGLILAAEADLGDGPMLIVRYTLTSYNFDGLLKLRSFLDSINDTIPIFVVPIKGVDKQLKPTIEQLYSAAKIENVFVENYCPAGKTFFAVDVYGNVMSCFLTRHVLGTVSELEKVIEAGKQVRPFECEDDEEYIKALSSLRMFWLDELKRRALEL